MGLFDLFKKKPEAPGVDREVEALIAKLASADVKTRFEACRALGRLGTRAQAAVPKLNELTADDDGDVCNAAAAALSEIERKRA